MVRIDVMGFLLVIFVKDNIPMVGHQEIQSS
jgi:hypothetical protein